MENNMMENKKFIDIMDKLKTRLSNIDFEELEQKSYIDDRNYPENFSNWYPHIKSFGVFSHSNIISNQIFTLDETKEFRKTEDINEVDWDKLNLILKPTLDKMEPYTMYSIKNGCFSNKFSFKTCIATKDNLAKQLWKINYMSSMYETGGYTELVVRDYIPCDLANTFTIYKGMPLRTEVRVFYNMGTKQIEYMVDYWDYDYCIDDIRNMNDKYLFQTFHNKTMYNMFNNTYDKEKSNNILTVKDHKKSLDKVTQYIKDNISSLEFDSTLEGIWSMDFMLDDETGKVYLIDMARGFRSAYWDINKLNENTKLKFSKG